MAKLQIAVLIMLTSISVTAQTSKDYYSGTQGLGGEALKTKLYSIIKEHRQYEYTADTTDVWDILKDTDRDPNNSENVILFYTGWSVNGAQEWNDNTGWSREHIWPKSHGQFDPDIVGPGAGTDVHHLRPADITVNSARNNRWYAESDFEYLDNGIPTGNNTSDTRWVWEPRATVKGDAARMIFYMATRYRGENGEPDLSLVNYLPADNNSPEPIFALLSDLETWNTIDPVDDWERGRNEIIFTKYQHNRNPFIDHPEWIQCIWNNNCTGLWYTTLSDTLVSDRDSYSYSVSASGSFDTQISISCETSLPTWLNFVSSTSAINSATATLTGEPGFSDIGTYPVSLKVSDGTNSTYQNFNIIVYDGNPIAFISSPLTQILQETVYNYNITAFGDPGASFTLTATQIPLWLNLTNNTGASATLTGTPDISDIGTHHVILSLTDDTKKTITQEFDIEVLSTAGANTVIISQYYEGDGTNNDKYLEITNVGSTSVDLSPYYLGRWSNTDQPAGVYANGNPLSGFIAGGQTLLYKNPNAVNPAYAVNIAFGSTEATFVNGNDPVALLRYGNTWEDRVDCIYASIAGNTFWGLDKGFYRKPEILTGNTNMSNLDGSGEWTGILNAEANTAIYGSSAYLGTHVFNTVTGILLKKDEIAIYPNPVREILYVDIRSTFKNAEVIDISGKIIFRTQIINSSLCVNTLYPGLYFIKLSDNKGITVWTKFIKK